MTIVLSDKQPVPIAEAMKSLERKVLATSVCYLGVDIGLYGAISAIESEHRPPLMVTDMPLFRVRKGEKSGSFGNQPNWYRIKEIIDWFVNRTDVDLTVELNSPFGKDGKFGWRMNGLQFGYWRAFGLMYGSLLPPGRSFRYHEVTTADWIPEFGLYSAKRGEGDRSKDPSRLKALHIFPEAPCREPDQHNRAESLLLATYGHRAANNGLRREGRQAPVTPRKRRRLIPREDRGRG